MAISQKDRKEAVAIVAEMNRITGAWERVFEEGKAPIALMLAELPFPEAKKKEFLDRMMEEYQALVPDLDALVTDEQLKHLTIEDMRAALEWVRNPISRRIDVAVRLSTAAVQPKILKMTMEIGKRLGGEILDGKKPLTKRARPASA